MEVLGSHACLIPPLRRRATIGAVPTGSRDLLEAGRAALARGDWVDARAHLEAALAEGDSAQLRESLSWAAWWQSDADATIRSREAAYRLYRDGGDQIGAARMAGWLATDHVDFRGELALAQGWLARGRRLLDGLDLAPEHGWLDIHEAEMRLMDDDPESALDLGRRAGDVGRQLGVVDLEMMGLATEGLALVTRGEVRRGLALVDEAAVAALAGDVADPKATVWCCCYMVYACEQLRDYERAAQWSRKFGEWSERAGASFASQFCRAHYAGVLVWNGAWAEAEAELVASIETLGQLRPPMAAEASVRLAELRRRQGRLDEATALFEDVPTHPRALIGLAEISLDRGDAHVARDLVGQYLRSVPVDSRTSRVPALELQVRASLDIGDVAAAAGASAELDELSELIGTHPVRGAARSCAGMVLGAGGDHEGARGSFEDALRYFRLCNAPFESGRVRVELSRVLRALGRDAEAEGQLRTALEAFTLLGADAQITDAKRLLGTAADPDDRVLSGPLGRLSRREMEVLTLIAEGLTNQQVAQRLVISEHTVKRHVASILRRLGLPSRSAAAALAGRSGVST